MKKIIQNTFGSHIKMWQQHIVLLFLNKNAPKSLPFYLPTFLQAQQCCPTLPLLYLPDKKSNIKINMAQMLYQQTPTLLYPLLTSSLLLYCHLSTILPCHGLLWIEVVWAPTCHVLFGRKANMHISSTVNSNYMLFWTTHLFSCPRVSCNL